MATASTEPPPGWSWATDPHGDRVLEHPSGARTLGLGSDPLIVAAAWSLQSAMDDGIYAVPQAPPVAQLRLGVTGGPARPPSLLRLKWKTRRKGRAKALGLMERRLRRGKPTSIGRPALPEPKRPLVVEQHGLDL